MEAPYDGTWRAYSLVRKRYTLYCVHDALHIFKGKRAEAGFTKVVDLLAKGIVLIKP